MCYLILMSHIIGRKRINWTHGLFKQNQGSTHIYIYYTNKNSRIWCGSLFSFIISKYEFFKLQCTWFNSLIYLISPIPVVHSTFNTFSVLIIASFILYWTKSTTFCFLSFYQDAIRTKQTFCDPQKNIRFFNWRQRGLLIGGC